MEIIFSSIKHLILPSVTLGYYWVEYLVGLKIKSRGGFKKDYIEAAKSRGINQSRYISMLYKYPSPNIDNYWINNFFLIGGALLIEITFSWPGIALGLQELLTKEIIQ